MFLCLECQYKNNIKIFTYSIGLPLPFLKRLVPDIPREKELGEIIKKMKYQMKMNICVS